MGSTLGCFDGNCIWQRPKGMQTNGGCRCTRDLERNTREYREASAELRVAISSEWRELRRGIAEQRDRVAELECELDRTRARLLQIEHAAWHLCDDAETRFELEHVTVVVDHTQFEELGALLPEECPRATISPD